VNFASLIQMIWRDSLGEKGLGSVIIKMTEEQKALLAAQQQAALEGGQQDQSSQNGSAGGNLEAMVNTFRGVTGG